MDALQKLIAKNAGKIRFGLVMFPTKGTTTPECVQAQPLLSPALGNEQKIRDLFVSERPASPTCVTNIDEGIKQASTEPLLYTTERRSFVLLVSDGAQSANCNDGSAANASTVNYITELYNKKVPTYVIGFDVGTNMGAQAALNSFATAGGLENPNGGTTKFYPANNQAELEATLDNLASLTAGEISLCRGMPCPDKRCLSATAMCTDGYCVEPLPNLLGPDGGQDTGNVTSGCSCRVSDRSAVPSAGLATLLCAAALLGLWRRRAFRH